MGIRVLIVRKRTPRCQNIANSNNSRRERRRGVGQGKMDGTRVAGMKVGGVRDFLERGVPRVDGEEREAREAVEEARAVLWLLQRPLWV